MTCVLWVRKTAEPDEKAAVFRPVLPEGIEGDIE
jgi:hypothetical protein